MKVLLLSCSTGEGHNSAAQAIGEALARCGAESELLDPVSFHGKRAQRFVSGFYNNLIRTAPKAFGLIYKAGELFEATKITSPVYYANARYAEKLYHYIAKQEFDAVISTHVYGMEAMTAIRKQIDAGIPSYGVMTDYTCTPFFAETKLDGYFVAPCEIKEKLLRYGIPKEKIIETGIPVSGKFTRQTEKGEARTILGLPEEKKIYLVMTGGVGCQNMISVCDSLMDAIDEDCCVYVMTGRNEDLKKRLGSRYSRQLYAVGFTDQINLYMHAADVMITKPGGLSSTEAAVANIPLVHCNAIPGCETCNAAYFEKNGLSRWARRKKDIVPYANELVYDKSRSEAMQNAQRQIINPCAADDIVRFVMKG